MMKATICAAAAAGFLAFAAPGSAQAAMPVDAGIHASASGAMIQTVAWRYRHHWHRWHHRHHWRRWYHRHHWR
jgi:uncharacterized membrane protein HdeD (DUF308 family)